MLRHAFICAAFCSLSACSTENQNDTADSFPVVTSGAISCTSFYRQSNQLTSFTETVLRFEPKQPQTFTVEKLEFQGGFSSDQYEGNVFNLLVLAGETRLWGALYQFGRSLPDSQLIGGHGFTGLVSLTHPSDGGDYQLICETVRD